MSITASFMTPAANAAGLRYAQLATSWRTVLDGALVRPDFGSQAMHDRVQQQALAIGINYLRAENDHLEDDLNRAASEARQHAQSRLGHRRTADLDDAASEHLSAMAAYVHHQLSSQVERDVAQLVQATRRTSLEVTLAARASGKSVRAALIEHRIGTTQSMKFFAYDRANRGWESHKFIRGVYRHALLGVWNENVLMELADAGRTVAVIEHANPDADLVGDQVSIGPNSAIPSYAEIRASVFHPNSDAYLAVPE